MGSVVTQAWRKEQSEVLIYRVHVCVCVCYLAAVVGLVEQLGWC